MNCCLLFIQARYSMVFRPVQWFLFRQFKQEDIFCVLQDHQCIQVLFLGLKMPRVRYQYRLERFNEIRSTKHVGIQDSDLHQFRFNRLCAFFWQAGQFRLGESVKSKINVNLNLETPVFLKNKIHKCHEQSEAKKLRWKIKLV